MTNKLLLLFLIILLTITPLQAEKKSPKDLPEKYRKWLEEDVVYIISNTEKEVFLQLETDKERELFIEAFWKHRDPTPGTPENEFKNEHYRRISYANYHFGRGVPKPGWRTDRGRIYIILGEPRDIERFSGESHINNTEVWFYQGLREYGLPPGFNLIFFQKGGIGEYILYSPTADGPQALLVSYFGDQANYLAAYQALRKINPTLAQTTMSLIPGESASFGHPSLSSDILLQNVQTVPQRQIKDKYAEKFLAYKDIVEVDYTANYIDNDHSVKVLRDPSGIYFVHYMVELTKFSLQEYENKYSTHLVVNGSVTDEQGKIIYQYEGVFPVNLDEQSLKSVTYRPFNLYDMFPLLPGKYKLSLILKNEVSKEFTSLEKNITVPEEDPALQMSSLILGYKVERSSSEPNRLMPFIMGSDQVFHQPRNIFLPQDKLFLAFQILGLDQSFYQKGLIKYEFFREEELITSSTKKLIDYQSRVNFKEEFSLQDFVPASYRLKVTLSDSERDLVSEQGDFDITPVSALPRPWVYNKRLLPSSDPVYDFILGKQHLNKGEIEKARIRLETACQKKPDSLDFALGLSQAYFLQSEFQKTKEVLLPFFESRGELPYQAYFLLGIGHQSLGEYDKSISVFNKAISHFGINFNLLNTLGESYFRAGSLDEALAAWEKSLEINPDQPEIKKNIEAIKE